MWQSVEILNVLNTSTLEPIFSKTKTFFKKLEYLFLVENTGIEKATFPYRTAKLGVNAKTTRMENARWINHNERSFANNYLIFSKILFQFENLV